MQQSHLVSLVPLFPLIGAILLGLLALANSHNAKGPNKTFVALVACLGPIASCVVAIMLFNQLGAHPKGFVHTVYTWFSVGNLKVPVEFYADRLSGVMILIVTFIGSLIHLYSVGYMWEERGFTRFFTYLNLFTFSMLVLVLGKNIPMMFLGWEGVGACSYFLIGYYFKDTPKALAANKAFIVNRVGDFGFLIGTFVLFYYLGSKGVWTLDFQAINQHAGLFTPAMATVVGLLLFVGAMGKSAQIPLHVWLADAMAGPTPVSALIHAATMVTAGVYMIARLSPVYAHSPVAGNVIAGIGMATAVMAATIAITQTNIKKVLAYSTVSQLGYMFVAVGVGAYGAGVFHLFTHAFFKALLFLGAGAVIHAMHHEEEMNRFGGLRKFIPFTYVVMLIGCLAIAGVPPFAGFFSKDAILAAAYEANMPIIYLAGLVTSGLTAFYMFRMLFLTFHGAPRFEVGHGAMDHDHSLEHAHGPITPHEGPWTMNLPLAVLALGTVLVGFLGLPVVMGGSSFDAWLAPALAQHAHHEAISASLEYTLMAFAIIVGGLGILFAYIRYGSHKVPDFAKQHGAMWHVFAAKYFFDDFYKYAIVEPLLAISRWGLWKTVDNLFIDGLVNGLPRLYLSFANSVRFVQNGVVRLYAYAMVAGVLAILFFVMARFSLLRF